MATFTVTARYQPAIRQGANLLASTPQTVFARSGLYRKIVAGTLTQNIRLRLSHTGAVRGAPLVIRREDVEPYTVTIEDWNGAVLSVMPASQQWSTALEMGVDGDGDPLWFVTIEGQRT